MSVLGKKKKKRGGGGIFSRKFSNYKKSLQPLDKFLGNMRFSKHFLVPSVLILSRPMHYGFDYKWIKAHLFLGPWQVHSQHLKREFFTCQDHLWFSGSWAHLDLIFESGTKSLIDLVSSFHFSVLKLLICKTWGMINMPEALSVTYWSLCENSRDIKHGLRE